MSFRQCPRSSVHRKIHRFGDNAVVRIGSDKPEVRVHDGIKSAHIVGYKRICPSTLLGHNRLFYSITLGRILINGNAREPITVSLCFAPAGKSCLITHSLAANPLARAAFEGVGAVRSV